MPDGGTLPQWYSDWRNQGLSNITMPYGNFTQNMTPMPAGWTGYNLYYSTPWGNVTSNSQYNQPWGMGGGSAGVAAIPTQTTGAQSPWALPGLTTPLSQQYSFQQPATKPQQIQPATTGNAPSWGNVPPPPPGVDPNWYAQWSQAFQQQHGGQTFVQYYAPTSGGNPYNAQNQALTDAAWGQQFYSTYGRPPTDYDWQAHWYSRYGGGGGGGSSEATSPSWWGQQLFGDGVVQWPGMESPIDLKNVKYLDQIPAPYRSWFQEVMNTARSQWENPLIPPVMWSQPKGENVSSST